SQFIAKLDHFTEEELVHLNRLIVERLRIMRDIGAHQAMTQFRIGQRVSFTDPRGREVGGVLTRYNRKSVSVIADDGTQWTVSPALLHADER
ncbi:MAG TPA: hypothetical protein VLI90_06125, partial [Tepidisphaeraceae bacterium]|nr:hypothetical protein [Tepidisphaeraceae bacterium]